MSTKSDFEVMSEMAKKNMDISMSGNLVELKRVKKGGLIVMGVDNTCINKLMNSVIAGPEGDIIVALYILNKKQFFELKDQPETTTSWIEVTKENVDQLSSGINHYLVHNKRNKKWEVITGYADEEGDILHQHDDEFTGRMLKDVSYYIPISELPKLP